MRLKYQSYAAVKGAFFKNQGNLVTFFNLPLLAAETESSFVLLPGTKFE